MLSAEERRRRTLESKRNWRKANRAQESERGKRRWAENILARRINIDVSTAISNRTILPANQCLCASCQDRAWGYRTIRVCFDENRVFIAPVCRSCLQRSDLPEIEREVEKLMGEHKTSIASKYREFAMRHDTIPNDRQLAEFWNCSFDAIKDGRRTAIKAGFGIEKISGRERGFTVVSRPGLTPTVVQPTLDEQPVSKPVATSNGIDSTYAARIDLELQRKAIEDDLKTLKDAIESSTDRLEMRISELAMIMAELVQITRSVWS